ncbi:DNA alkylation repair protein [uncultured Lactiplantibacillus sp.]|uniref:DNA alkylation repair protein n=2 Tax=Lactiplantibacillus plantarum TaxID=1590 RepID=UPI00338FE266
MGATSRYHASIRLERGRIANLQTVILTNRDDDDSFIQKAIGWASRDYGKVNPEWGACFCHK